MPLVQITSDPRARLKPCLRCGYSLRSIPDARNCPECGLAIWLSLSNLDDLEMSNPAWTRRLAAACLVLAAAHVIVAIVMLLLHLSAIPQLSYTWRILSRKSVYNFLPIISAAYMILIGLGLLMLGAPEGRYPERAAARRFTIAAGYLALTMALWLGLTAFRSRLSSPITLAFIAAHVAGAATWIYLAQLARRIPNRRLTRLTRIMLAALAISLAWRFFNGEISLYFAVFAPWSRWAREVLPLSIILLLYPITAALLLLYTARTFARAAKAADRNWNAS